MSVPHKFLNNNWNNGFWTESAILKNNLYQPEVLIIGTNNPLTPNANFADFFYGRNYFWTAFKNLVNGNFELQNRRMPTNGAPQFPLNPSIEEIFEMCIKFKFSFADFNSNILVNQNNINFLPNDNIILNGMEYNLINDNARNGIGGLGELDQLGEVQWNTENIINYLSENPQIKDIYLTRQASGIWLHHWDQLKNCEFGINKNFKILYTPSGNALKGIPRMNSLINHWLFNETINYNTLNHEWLIECGVNLDNF